MRRNSAAGAAARAVTAARGAPDAGRLQRTDPAGARALTKRYGGLIANNDIDFSVRPRRAARHHRPERRRQDHLLQDADLRGAADRRHHRVRGQRHHRLERHRRLPARPDQELSGQPVVHPADRAREPHHRRARPNGAASSASICCADEHAIAGLREQVEHTLELVNLTERAEIAGRRARLWRKAAAGNRAGARHHPEPACCSTNRWPA